MSQDVDQHISPQERLSEIDGLLVNSAEKPLEWESVRAQLAAIDETVGQCDDSDSRDCAKLLSRIAEFAAYTLESPDDLRTADGEDLLAALRTGGQALHSKLDGADDSEKTLKELLKEIEERWGESLSLLDGDDSSDPWEDRNDPWFDEPSQDVVEEQDRAGDSLEPAPDAGQISLLLEALASDSPEVDDCDDANTPFPAGTDDAGPADASAGVPAPPTPARIEMIPELLEAYLDDAGKGLASLEQSVLALESNPQNRDPLQQICRELHTLKGASASVGLSELASYLHAVEDSVQAQSAQAGGGIDVESILGCVDAVREQIDALTGSDSAAPKVGTNDTVDSSPESAAPSPAFSPGLDSGGSGRDETVRVKASQLDRLMDMLAELVMLRNRRETRVEHLKSTTAELIRCSARLRGTGDDVLNKRFGSGDNADVMANPNGETVPFGTMQGSVRTRYLSEIANDLTEISRGLRDIYKPVSVENQAVSRFIRQFRQELMQLRRLPVAGLFQRLQRSVRDAARVEGKQVRLELVGEHSGLERSLQERIYEPLLHLVRNAVSHGIETPELRESAGKNPTGTITLEAHGGPNLLVLEIRDDGRGLDYDAIRRRGLERGLLSVDRQPSRPELAQLIFHPGFSTRDATSEISGRGVGMDVVAATLDRLHARIDVESEAGRGTTIRLTIPLHSVIEHTMVVRISGQLFALPTQFVRSVGYGANSAAEQNNDARNTGDDAGDDRPSVHLADLLGLPRSDRRVPRGTITIGRSSQAQSVFEVDEILGPEEVVMRSLPAMLKLHRLFAGVTLSGAGETVLLLDGQQLLELARTTADSSDEANLSDAFSDGHQSTARKSCRALVVDDSLSARRSLILKLKARGDWQFTEAGDGAEALDRLRDQTFDVVFTDLDMPRMGGMELLEEIKTGRNSTGIQVVVVTSRDEDEFRSRAGSLSADGYLTKPVDESALDDVLSKLNIAEGGAVGRQAEPMELSQ